MHRNVGVIGAGRVVLPIVVSLLAVLGVFASLIAAPALAQGATATTSTSGDSADEAAIRKGADAFAAAFQRQDADAIAQMWTDDGEYVDQTGQRYEGRDAVRQEYAQFFKDHKPLEMRINVESIRFIGPGVAVEDGTAELVPAPAGVAGPSRYVAVDVKQPDGRWLLASVHDARGSVPAPIDPMPLLETLAGDWSAEHGGAQADVTAHWDSQKKYLERHFTITRGGDVVASSTEIIGRDPATGQVRSWTFSSDGGRAEGTWTALADGWVVQSVGVTPAGRPTFAVDVWAPLLDGALGWRSTHRAAGGAAVKDADDIVLKKKSPADTAKN